MKWAKLVDDPEKATQKESPDDRLSIRYVSQRDLDSFGVWKQYKFPPDFKATARGKRDYEMMVGGYLLCYDYFLRSDTIDHCVYFKWEQKDKKAKDDGKTPLVYESLTMLLWPKPVRKPSRTASLHQESKSTATPAPGPLDDAVDPPVPPPPPPPTLEP
jgi:hypothetical protein